MEKNKYFNSFDGLKCIAYLSIFLQHSGFSNTKFGGWGVSFFLVLSGFLLTYKYLNKELKCSFKDNLKFAIKKIKSIYILHFFCIIIYIPSLFIGNVKNTPFVATYKILSNMLLLQEWFPMSNSSLNECSWYLSTILFCYFMFPLILSLIKKYKLNKKNILISIVILYIVQILLSIFASYLKPLDDYNLTYWFAYRFPPVRLIDFLIGCLLSMFYVNSSERPNCLVGVIGFILVVVSLFTVFVFVNEKSIFHSSIIKFSFLEHSVIYTPGVCFSIYYLSFESGFLSKLFSNNFASYLVKNGKYAFLIHYVVFDCIRVLLTIISFYLKNDILIYSPYIKMSIGMLLTFLLSYLWKRLEDYSIFKNI